MHLVGFIIRIIFKVHLKSEIIFPLISLNLSQPDKSNTAYCKTKKVKQYLFCLSRNIKQMEIKLSN